MPKKTLTPVVNRGGRPRKPFPKLAIKLRLDPEVLDHFRKFGPGWQTQINAVLRRATKRRLPRA
jgi:uncharacterized protein (DUF4415 family)